MGTRLPLYDAAIHAVLALETAAQAGLPAEELAAEAGIARPTYDQFPSSIPYPALATLMSRVQARGPHRNLGLQMATQAEPTLAGLLGYYLINQPVLRDILAISYEILGRLSNVFRVDLQMGRDPASFSLRPLDPEAPLLDQMAEFHVAIFVRNTRRYVSPEFRPLRVAFAHGAPADTSEHARWFQCPVVFGAGVTRMEFDATWLEVPIPAADPNLSRTLRPYAERELEHLPRLGVLSERLSMVLRLRMGSVPLTLQHVARHMGFAPRTLQHQLRQEGTTFKTVLDATRRSIALDVLRASDDPVELLAGRLGFADTGAFYRAFRRWTGTTPQAYRQQRIP